jgi:hypothetical protein
MNVIWRIVASETFHDGPANGIADEIQGKDLAVKFFASEQPGQPDIQ